MRNIKFKIVLYFIIFLLFNTSYSQIIDESKLDYSTYQKKKTETSQFRINADLPEIFQQIVGTPYENPNIPIEDAIDIEKYIVGPGDLFLLGIYGYTNQQIQLYVNPEGSIIIPYVGEVYLYGLSLKKAKEIVIEKVKKRYYSSEVSLNLLTPRTFLVSLTGLVQGKFRATPLTRVSEIIRYIVFDTLNVAKTYYENMMKQSKEPNLLRTTMSMRNITLHRKDSTVLKVDLYKYFMTNDDKYNPYLLEGDLIRVPYTLLEKNYVSVTGAVQLGGAYEYNEDDDLETVIGLGRGLDVYANPDSIILYRPYKYKPGFELINLSYEKDKHYPIKVNDRIFVKFKPEYYKMATVLILGEIKMPGYYPISYKNSRLLDVIEMAGGLTENAYLPLSIVFRYWDAEYLQKDTMEIVINQRANDVIISENDRKNFEIDVLSRRNRVVVDFQRLIEEGDQSQNILLEDKDIIYINDNKNIVYVYGQVNSEGYVPYVEGKSYEYYIEKAGGYGLAADESNTRIIRFNTRGWYKAKDTEVKNGDFIYVPKIEKKEFKEIVTVISQIAGVIIGIITTYILIRNTTK